MIFSYIRLNTTENPNLLLFRTSIKLQSSIITFLFVSGGPQNLSIYYNFISSAKNFLILNNTFLIVS